MRKQDNDFTTYAIEQSERDVRDDFKAIIDCALSNFLSKELTICELGFNRAIELNYILKRLALLEGCQPIQLYAYDHKLYFHPEYIDQPKEENLQGRSILLQLVPCLFEEIANHECRLPSRINICYSFKSLTYCDNELFGELFNTIIQSLDKRGLFFGSVNYSTPNAPGFMHEERLVELIAGAVRTQGEYHLLISYADNFGELLFAIENIRSLHNLLYNNERWLLIV